MIEVSNKVFSELIDKAFDSLPEPHRSGVKNVAIVVEEVPSEDQRRELSLRCDQTLLGLYRGTPLPKRQGRQPLLPDVITLFKQPLLCHSSDETELYENIRHTLWHEVAHYYGLNHDQIHALEH